MTRQDIPVVLVVEKLRSTDGIWRPIVTELVIMPWWQRIWYRYRRWRKKSDKSYVDKCGLGAYQIHKLQSGLDFAIEANQEVINVLLTAADKRHYNVIVDKDDVERIRMVLIPTQELLRQAIMEESKGKNPAV